MDRIQNLHTIDYTLPQHVADICQLGDLVVSLLPSRMPAILTTEVSLEIKALVDFRDTQDDTAGTYRLLKIGYCNGS